MIVGNPDFSAAPSALGYFYQARYALLILLEASSGVTMTVEGLDDIAFEMGGQPLQLLQTKHHIRSTAALTDAATDLWKTLRIWSIRLKGNEIAAPGTLLCLVTTGVASDGSAASKLRPRDRDEEGALSVLEAIASTSKSTTNKEGYEAFMALSQAERRALLQCVQVIDRSPSIIDVKDKILQKLKFSTRPEYLEFVYERLEGWWFDRAVRSLARTQLAPLTFNELLAEINSIQEQFRAENLPVDFPDPIVIEESDLPPDQRVFIEQLRLIAVTSPRIRNAISDYYRAFEQRSRWVRQELLFVGELEHYERKLIDEWQRQFEIMKEAACETCSDTDAQTHGRNLYNWVDRTAHLPIRPKFNEFYVMRGSYHMLANLLKVGWHRDFVARLQHLLAADGVKK